MPALELSRRVERAAPKIESRVRTHDPLTTLGATMANPQAPQSGWGAPPAGPGQPAISSAGNGLGRGAALGRLGCSTAAKAPPKKGMKRARDEDKADKFAESVLASVTCPISLSLVVQPVVAEDGQVYERERIKMWLQEKETSPFTRNPMGTQLVDSVASRSIVASAIENGLVDANAAASWHLASARLKIAGELPGGLDSAKEHLAAVAPSWGSWHVGVRVRRTVFAEDSSALGTADGTVVSGAPAPLWRVVYDEGGLLGGDSEDLEQHELLASAPAPALIESPDGVRISEAYYCDALREAFELRDRMLALVKRGDRLGLGREFERLLTVDHPGTLSRRSRITYRTAARLEEYLRNCGGYAGSADGWTIDVVERKKGGETAAGHYVYYFPPDGGKRCLSRAEVARALGLQPAKLSTEAAPRRPGS